MTNGNNGDNLKWWINLNELPDEALEVLIQARKRDLARLDVIATERDLTPVERITRCVINEARTDIRRLRTHRTSGRESAPEMSEARVAYLTTKAHVAMEGAIAALTLIRLRQGAQQPA